MIGSTPQPNSKIKNWIDFFRTQRLEHQIKLCHNKGFKLIHTNEFLKSISALFIGYTSQPSILGGDLWSGNIAFDEIGNTFTFDPCTYYNDRETDLAFTDFFGGSYGQQAQTMAKLILAKIK